MKMADSSPSVCWHIFNYIFTLVGIFITIARLVLLESQDQIRIHRLPFINLIRYAFNTITSIVQDYDTLLTLSSIVQDCSRDEDLNLFKSDDSKFNLNCHLYVVFKYMANVQLQGIKNGSRK